MRTTLSTLLAGIGLALALFLAALKIAHWPCKGSGCEAVLHSSYGTLLGLPIGLYAAALWLGVLFARHPSLRTACQAALALGSLLFVGIQLFVLRSICPYCMAHALIAWLALPLHRSAPQRWGALAGLAAAAVLTTLAGTANRVPHIGQPQLSRWLRDQPDALYWLGPPTPNSAGLVLSLHCPACLYFLGNLLRFEQAPPHGPAIYFRTDANDREMTAVFVSAVQAQPGNRREAFLGLTTLVLAHQDVLLSDPAKAAPALRALLPQSAAGEAAATALLTRQAKLLAAIPVETTPFLARPDGSASNDFQPEEIFPR